jgi:hypothetical protein
MLSFFDIPKGVLKRLDYYMSRFFGSVRNIAKNIGWINGVSCVSQGAWAGWEF